MELFPDRRTQLDRDLRRGVGEIPYADIVAAIRKGSDVVK
jgi:hypothetical protein